MGAGELVGVAASLSFLAGWRLYACVAAAGLAMRFGFLDLPQQIQSLDALANPWVIAVAGVAAIAIAVALILFVGSIGLIILSWRILTRLKRWWSSVL